MKPSLLSRKNVHFFFLGEIEKWPFKYIDFFTVNDFKYFVKLYDKIIAWNLLYYISL